jgi:hypothetical protein
MDHKIGDYEQLQLPTPSGPLVSLFRASGPNVVPDPLIEDYWIEIEEHVAIRSAD